jgi:hypothetical protein
MATVNKANASRNQRKHANRKASRNEKLRAELPRLESWVFSSDSYGDNVLRGSIYNRPGYTDGEHVQTSPILRIDHLLAVTVSGTKYLLGEPSADYVAYRKHNGLGPITNEVFHFDF